MRIGPVHDTGLSAVLWSSIPATASIVAPQELELELEPLSESLSGTFGLSDLLSPNWNIEVTFWISDRSDRSFRSVKG